MFEELRIRDYGLIDQVTLPFGSGLNVLTGETGAGKSMLIGALGLILGEKGNPDSIRTGAQEAEVSAVVRPAATPEYQEWKQRYGIEEDEGVLLLRRTLRRGGRGSTTIQNLAVTRGTLTELAEVLVDIHGQHEHQSLFRIAVHRKLLDRFAGIEKDVQQFSDIFMKLNDTIKSLADYDQEETRLAREADFSRYALEEINKAQLQKGEEARLGQQQEVLSRHEEMTASLETVLNKVSEGRGGALGSLREAREALGKASSINQELEEILTRFDGAFYEMEDAADQLRRIHEASSYSPGELAEIDDRLGMIHSLKKKYGPSVEEVLRYAKEAEEKLLSYESRDAEGRQLREEQSRLEKELNSKAAILSGLRKSAALGFQKKVEEHLHSLGIPAARFQVELNRQKSQEGRVLCGPFGRENVEFLLSANSGEPLKPLRSVASGGELSRIMLALKSVLAESDTVQTLVFDEIDAGIGGEVARSVGDHLRQAAGKKQLFCVTHLATIAVFADNHLKVEKRIGSGRTQTGVRSISGDERVREIARMLAGDSQGQVSLGYAARLLEELGEEGRNHPQ